MSIFAATADHAETVAGLLYDFNTEFEASTPSVATFAARFRQLLDRDDVVVLLADSVKNPSGFALITYRPTPYCDGPVAYLEELYVRPDLRAQGIGTRLLMDFIQRAKELGCCETQIGVDEADRDARRFYERHGFSNLEPDTGTRMLLYLRQL
ncbi:GNAT family N-acetyltransferase [Enteractinococcus fodinae]|uniref:GNAT superfamily N-acetyltransferase n=1 Tax=Enteractinococcus fodinae TaxID=684663 RepID=A0ABU2B637_9MICC|nr:GNAT family N-acetyltransferase [Enteractinococcus fodinae]MDR7347859.1 GNAT superfamily N-acetyltransferase [Enteractinococcus fodinae]